MGAEIMEKAGGDPDLMTLHPAAASWEAPGMPAWQHWDDEARAAILAVLKGIREPTPEMRGSGELEFLKRRRSASHLAVPAIYASMIDRLIQEFAPEGGDA